MSRKNSARIPPREVWGRRHLKQIANKTRCRRANEIRNRIQISAHQFSIQCSTPCTCTGAGGSSVAGGRLVPKELVGSTYGGGGEVGLFSTAVK
jgi:hypothetical protein